MARGTPHPDEVRAAVLAALLAGQSLPEVAKQYHLSEATVRFWRSLAGDTHTVEPQKRQELGGLVAGLLESSLITLQAQAEFSRSPAWLEKQSAADLAVLFGVINDKTFRLIAALESAGNNPEPE